MTIGLRPVAGTPGFGGHYLGAPLRSEREIAEDALLCALTGATDREIALLAKIGPTLLRVVRERIGDDAELARLVELLEDG